MDGVRLVGLFKSAGGTNQAMIEELTGMKVVRDGDDWVIPFTDPVLSAGPRDVFVFAPKPTELTKKGYASFAKNYVASYLVEDLERRMTRPERISVSDRYGIRTDLEQKKLQFFFLPKAHLPRFLEEELFP